MLTRLGAVLALAVTVASAGSRAEPARALSARDDGPCVAVRVQRAAQDAFAVIPASDGAVTSDAIRDAMAGGLPRARVYTGVEFAGALNASGGDLNANPLLRAYQRNAVVAQWSSGQVGTSASLIIAVMAGSSVILRQQTILRDSPDADDARNALAELGDAVAAKIGGMLFCIDLTEHDLDINFDDVPKRTHTFVAEVTNLRGEPADEGHVRFSVDTTGSSVVPEGVDVSGGRATTTFEMKRAIPVKLAAKLETKQQEPPTDTASITVSGDWRLDVSGTRAVPFEKGLDRVRRILSPYLPSVDAFLNAGTLGAKQTWTGNLTFNDTIRVPLQQTETGFEGTGEWTQIFDYNGLKMTSAEFDARFTCRRPTTFTAPITLTATYTDADRRTLHIVLHAAHFAFPTTGGDGQMDVTLHNGNLGQLADALNPLAAAMGMKGLNKQQTVQIEPDQPLGVAFDLTFDEPLPNAALARMFRPTPHDVTGADDLGPYRYLVSLTSKNVRAPADQR